MANIVYNDHPVKAAPAADDYIPIWDVSGNAAKKALRSALVGAVLTGGGAIATGGYTLTLSGNAQLRGTVDADGFILTVPATGTAGLINVSQRWTARPQFAAGVGLTGAKSNVANNSATALCDIVIGGAGVLAANYLAAITVTSGSTSSGQIWAITQGFNAAGAAKLGEALFGHSSIVITAAANTAGRKVTLTITQINGSAQACMVTVSVLPIMVISDPEITLTML